jgi:hypothetical protein
MKIFDILTEGKASKQEAGYQSNPKNNQKCINCTMWRDPNKCSAVAGNIDPEGWCEWYASGAYGKHGKASTNESIDLDEKQRLDPKCWKGYRKDGTKTKDGVRVNNCVKVKEDEYTWEGDLEMLYDDEEMLDEAEYQGRKVQLGKPMQGDVKKFKVYVKNPKGNVVKVNFGDPNMRIKKSNPARRKSFRARHNCDNPGPRTSARYWSCRKW